MRKTIYTKESNVLAKKLEMARLDAGLTQVKVANKLGSTQSYISKVESGELRVDIIKLKMFAKIYKKEISYFLK